jgi:hypothetical protein
MNFKSRLDALVLNCNTIGELMNFYKSKCEQQASICEQLEQYKKELKNQVELWGSKKPSKPKKKV